MQHHPVDEREPLGVELLDRRDVLEPGAVDQDVGLEAERPRPPSCRTGRPSGGCRPGRRRPWPRPRRPGRGPRTSAPSPARCCGDGGTDAAGAAGHGGAPAGEARGRDRGLRHAVDARTAAGWPTMCDEHTHAARIGVPSGHVSAVQRCSRCTRSASWRSSARAGSRQSSPSSPATRSRRCETVLGWMWRAAPVSLSRPPPANHASSVSTQAGAALGVVVEHRAERGDQEGAQLLGAVLAEQQPGQAQPRPGR